VQENEELQKSIFTNHDDHQMLGYERRLDHFFSGKQQEYAVVHWDYLVNKTNKGEVADLFDYMLRYPVQVLYAQGAKVLEQQDLFDQLLRLLRRRTVWSINLGELRFSSEQLTQVDESALCCILISDDCWLLLSLLPCPPPFPFWLYFRSTRLV
jgi:hypothetical protein